MSFGSAAFWLFCFVAVGLSWVTPKRYRWLTLLGASDACYGSCGPDILGVLVLLTAAVYLVSRVMARATGRRRRLLLALDIGLPLAALVVFKYLDLFWEALRSLASPFGTGRPAESFNLLVPIGISFYVFKLISYAVEVYHRRIPAEEHPGYFALYVAFFPQILAGPIERPGALIPQLRQPASFDIATVFAGGRLMLWGLFKKQVIAERLAFYVGEVFLAPEYKSFHLVIAAWLYYIQIYCDFSGYSDISIGISRTLGFSPPQNFDYPYLSRDVGEFWRRWHITLSSWLRDYLFLPTAYALTRRLPEGGWLGARSEAWAYAVATLVTMLLGGLWHGAAWMFVAWGALHGVFLVSSYASKGWRKRAARTVGLTGRARLHHALQVFVTFNLVALAWIPFRATSFENLREYLHYMQLKLPPAGVANLLFNAALVALLLALEYAQRNPSRFPRLQRAPLPVKAVGYAAFLVALIVLSVDSANPFIYFRF
ncbi:MAG: MBOAT family protein [Acidobacteria bacterium]|nr:MAG: MBOAT family protein [Acidobacteriota bacterium]